MKEIEEQIQAVQVGKMGLAKSFAESVVTRPKIPPTLLSGFRGTSLRRNGELSPLGARAAEAVGRRRTS